MRSNLFGMIFVLYLIGLVSCDAHAKTKKNAVETVQLNELNTVAFAGAIDFNSVDLLMSAVTAKSIMSGNNKVYLIIASYGGLYEASKILKIFLDKVPNLVLICRNCQSAAGMIFATFSGSRLITNDTIFIMHEMFNMKVTANLIQNKDYVNDLIQASREFNILLSNKLEMDIDVYEAKIRNTEWTVVGKDIIKYHLADKLVNINCNEYVKAIAPGTCGVNR